jgi:3-oxocholest-4-en-26-oate---CoA ligase
VSQFQLADLFEIVADAVPDRPALIAGDVRLTYGELDARANQLAHHLLLAGLAPGDHVAILAHNRAEWVETWFACYKISAVPININYRYAAEELRYVLADAEAVAVVHEAEYTAVVDQLRPELPKLRITLEMGERYETALDASDPSRVGFPARSIDDHYILYTGGTTGMPKGVVWRHEDIFFAAMMGGGGFGIPAVADPSDLRARAENPPMVSLAAAPLMHGAAQWAVCQAGSGLLAGGTIVLNTLHQFDPDAVWQLVVDEKVNSMSLVGDAMARPLADALEAAVEAGTPYDLSSLFMIGSGGALFSTAVKESLTKHLPTLRIGDSYGSSEVGAGGPGAGGDGAMQFVVGPEVAVLDENLKPVEPGSGVIGQLGRRGHIPLGYFGDPEKTARTFPVDADGQRWAVPGDFAIVEADGTVTLLGRGSQCINTGGEKVYPEEVESVLKAHPLVVDVLVVGLPDDRFGERVAALVQPRPDATVTLESLQEHCRGVLAGYKTPRTLQLTALMPRSPSGKADYRAVKAAFDAA